jgi:hypothetical protein
MSPNHVAPPRIAVVAMTSGTARAITSALNELGFCVRQTPSVGEAAGRAAGSAVVFTQVVLPGATGATWSNRRSSEILRFR